MDYFCKHIIAKNRKEVISVPASKAWCVSGGPPLLWPVGAAQLSLQGVNFGLVGRLHHHHEIGRASCRERV